MTIDELKELMETGEEFKMEGFNRTYRYNKNIGEFQNDNCLDGNWHEVYITTHHLFSHTLIRKPWKPKVGKEYWSWYINSYHVWVAGVHPFNAYSGDLLNIAFDNCFRTKELCESHTEIRDKLIEMRKEYV